MKNNNIFNIPNVSTRIANLLDWINGSFRVKAGRPLVNWLIWAGRVVEGRRKLSTVKVAVVFTAAIWRLYRKNGLTFVVKYLKASQVLLMQSASGHKLRDSTELGVRVTRAKDGMPAFIPRLMRSRIRAGDAMLLTTWVSWLGLYRVLEIPGKLKTETITEPGKRFNLLPYNLFIPVFYQILLSVSPKGISSLFGSSRREMQEKMQAKPYVINKSPPTFKLDKADDSVISTSMQGIVRSGLALFKDSKVFDSFESFASLTGNDQLMETLFMVTEQWQGYDTSDSGRGLGKLGLKFEAAGKVRVFAMVDCWTQWLLRPLHDLIFETLKGIPQDGTFDQFAPVKRLLDKGYNSYWCYDLSAATDRLPVLLQVALLSPIFGEQGAKWWASILVDRTYWLRTMTSDGQFGSLRGLKYAVGQPMGALSSWAMLALTHHFIVQMAARRAGHVVGWFSKYAVLGDDIVIADGRVAQQYLIILADLGVKVGLAKSLVSRQRSLEFAKRFIWRGVDCSPVSFKELAAAKCSFTSLEAFAVKFRSSLATLFAIQGKGYRVLGGLHKAFWDLSPRIRKALVTLLSPGHALHVSIPTWLESVSLVKQVPIKHWDKVGWALAMHWIKSMDSKIRRIENLLSSFDSVTGETGLGLTDMEWFDINSVASAKGSDFLKEDARAISMMSMELYYESFRVMRIKIRDLKDEWLSIKEFLEFHGPNAGIHWEILGVLPAEVEKLEKLLDGLSLPKSFEKRTEDILRDRPFKWFNQWAEIRRVSLTGKLPSSISGKRTIPDWLIKADLVDVDEKGSNGGT